MWAKHTKQPGFTIVELLIVIVVIGILAAITITAYNGVQTRARDTIRISDLKNIQKLVELYKADTGTYPLPANGSGQWTGNCATFGSVVNYIPSISSITSSKLPLDPRWKSSDDKCYLYRSDGSDYIAIAWNSMETICGGDPSNACNSAQIRSMDRSATGAELSIGVWSTGGSGW